jgi:chemosensory pili system protein ChpA (sensor histidine kinase/response regulator)
LTEEPEDAQAEHPAAASVAASAASRVDPSLKDNFESDAEIVEIFVEEVDEVLETIEEWLPVWSADLEHEDALTEVRRAFHTLKGSGRIVGANIIGEVAWSVENMLNRLIDGTVPANDQFVTVVDEARGLIPRLKEAFEAKDAPDIAPVGGIMEMADILASGGSLDEAEDGSEREHASDAERAAEEKVADDISEAGRAAAAADLTGEESAAEAALKIFVGEARQHLATLEAAVVEAEEADDSGLALDEDTARALHTLAGSAGMAEFTTIEALARPVYELASVTRGTEDRMATGAVGDLLIRSVKALSAAVDAVEAQRAIEDRQDLVAEAEALVAAAAEDPAGAGRAALMELAGITHILAADEFLESWRNGAMDLAEGDELTAALSEMAEVAAAHEIAAIATLARAFATALKHMEHDALDDHHCGVLMEGQQQLLGLFDALAAEQQFADISGIVARLGALTEAGGATESEETFDLTDLAEELARAPEPGNVVEFPSDGREEGGVSLEDLEASLLDDTRSPGFTGTDAGGDSGVGADTEVVQAPVETVDEVDEVLELDIAAGAVPAAVAELLPEEVDDEIIEVFFEEADEILVGLEENIHRWSSEPDNRLYLEHMLRGLHTLKGGARLSGLTKLGDATHHFESFLIDVQSGTGTQDDGFFDDLHARYDGVTNLLTVIRKALAGEAVSLPEVAGQPVPGEEPEPSSARAVDTGPAKPPVEARPSEDKAPAKIKEPPATTARETEADASAEARGGQEIVRVGSGLLEDLVNLAGESSIVRARVEQGMSDFTGALEEMETTIERLREQLRRLEIETESQILFRQDRPDGPAYTNFDPL